MRRMTWRVLCTWPYHLGACVVVMHPAGPPTGPLFSSTELFAPPVYPHTPAASSSLASRSFPDQPVSLFALYSVPVCPCTLARTISLANHLSPFQLNGSCFVPETAELTRHPNLMPRKMRAFGLPGCHWFPFQLNVSVVRVVKLG